MKFSKVKSIKKTESQPIYHMNIEKNHNFFGNNICLHNCDYYSNESNDGNIGICLFNLNNDIVELEAGSKVAQGVFTKYLIVDHEQEITNSRTGGVGSTGK